MKTYTVKINFKHEANCMNCPLCKSDDNCALQDEDFDSFDTQMSTCPLEEVNAK